MELVFDYTRSADPLGPLLECLRHALSHELANRFVAIQGLAGEAGLELDAAPAVSVAEGLPELAVPPLTLYHVYVELMRHAVAGSPRPVRITVGGQRCPGGGTFWVADDGSGFPGERPEQFFEPFVHLPTPGPATPSSANPGETGEGAEPFGLGLFLVRQAVACWHGRLHVRSEPGRGTTFTFFIPHGDDAEGGRA
jgi:signal transduction histidine kinase